VDHVSPRAAVLLNHLRRVIPAGAEVVASQGIIGRFAGRQAYDDFQNPIPLVRRNVVFIVSPYQGIDFSPAMDELDRLAFLSHLGGVRILSDQGGIWAFSWVPPKNLHTLIIPSPAQLPAWTLASAVGTPVTTGPYADWHMTAVSMQPGYLVQQAYWRVGNGTYQAKVKISSDGPAELEVWNATGNVLLYRIALPVTNGIETLTFQFSLDHQYPDHLFRGIGPFQLQPTPPVNKNNQIELRVWTPGNEVINVYSLALKPV
jgi:hypothetical protein